MQLKFITPGSPAVSICHCRHRKQQLVSFEGLKPIQVLPCTDTSLACAMGKALPVTSCVHPRCAPVAACRAEAYALLQRQQQLESMLAEVKGQKPPELLLESAEGLLARMKAKLQKS